MSNRYFRRKKLKILGENFDRLPALCAITFHKCVFLLIFLFKNNLYVCHNDISFILCRSISEIMQFRDVSKYNWEGTFHWKGGRRKCVCVCFWGFCLSLSHSLSFLSLSPSLFSLSLFLPPSLSLSLFLFLSFFSLCVCWTSNNEGREKFFIRLVELHFDAEFPFHHHLSLCLSISVTHTHTHTHTHTLTHTNSHFHTNLS